MEENILRLVKLLELEGFDLTRYGIKYILYYCYTGVLSIAICNHHHNINLNEKVCVTTCNDWDKYIINLSIPINSRQRNFIVEKILDVSNGINIPRIANYNFNIYGLR